MNIADFTDSEQKLVTTQLLQRYGKLVPLQLADSELQLDPASTELTVCPTLNRTARGPHIVVCKTSEGVDRSQVMSSETEPHGTGKDEYTDLNAFVTTLLQVQSDHERQLANISSGATRAKIDEDYSGPLVI